MKKIQNVNLNVNNTLNNYNDHNSKDTRWFLNEIFGNKPPETYINIWTLQNRRSKFFKNIEEASDYVEKICNNKIDIYVSCGLLRADLGPNKRGSKEDVIGLAGLYADIDFKSKDKPNYPPDLKSAMTLIKGKGWDPSLIVRSGNGIHAWWLFKEPWMFENKKEGDKIEMLNKRLQATIAWEAEKKGWEIDSVYDRTRVLRVPNTKNCKNPKNILDVKVHEKTDMKYGDPNFFDQVLISEDQMKVSAEVTPFEKKKLQTSW